MKIYSDCIRIMQTMKLTEIDINTRLTNLFLHIYLPFYYFHSLVISVPNAETRMELEPQVRVDVLPSFAGYKCQCLLNHISRSTLVTSKSKFNY